MPSTYFPLRWEGIGDQWWYASPIDWASANGHYDLVRELLHLDPNLLIKLTSLRRILRLETLWDDESQFNNVAKCRCDVARKLLLESETVQGQNSLLQAGYGGWVLYTAASAGDVSFVKELLQRDPLLAFGEGEYGVTDILYAASRSRNSQVFRVLFDFSSVPRSNSSGDLEQQFGDTPSSFKWEIVNRAVHAAARGGNLEILMELLQDCSDVSVYRDVHGSTVLHSASGRGQTEVVKHLATSCDIINSVDNRGNTALHVAAFHGHVSVVHSLLQLSNPSSTNNFGDTFLHMAVAGFHNPGFHRLDRHIELMTSLASGKCKDIINVRNNKGRTALHTALTGSTLNPDLVEILMTVDSIDLNVPDLDGMTPLDVIMQQPESLSTEILVKHLMSKGAIRNSSDNELKSVITYKMEGIIGSSPGTSFRVPDTSILGESVRLSPSSSDSESKKLSSRSHTRRHLKSLFSWSRQWSTKSEIVVVNEGKEQLSELKNDPPSSPLKKSPVLIHEKRKANTSSSSSSKRLMDQYFCFGAEDVVREGRGRKSGRNQGLKLTVPSVA